MKKRILSTLLALCMVLALLPRTARAIDITYPVTGGNLYFDVTTGTITDCDSSVTKADIPSEIYGVPVTTIWSDAFSRCTNLTSVTIPNSVTYLGDRVFFECSSLTNISIPNSVTYIGGAVFFKCNKLTSVSIPNSVTYLGMQAFLDCTSLTSTP